MKNALLFASMFFSSFCFSQENPAFTQGMQFAGISYGFISPYKSFVTASAGGATSSGTFSTTGPIGISYEKAVTERFSAGGKLVIGSLNYEYSSNINVMGTNYGSNGNAKISYFGLLFRGNYHFGNSNKFDPYIGGGLGYGNFKITATSSDNSGINSSVNASVPSAMILSAQLGANYYLTDNIAAFGEIGFLVGSFIQVGVLTRF